MNTETSYQLRKKIVWGVALMCMGAVFFLDAINLMDVKQLWHYAPLVLVAFGLNKMVGNPSAKHFSSGLWEVFVGLWLVACFEHLFGLTFHNSWPFFIIASGFSMIIEPVIKKRFAANEESRNEG